MPPSHSRGLSGNASTPSTPRLCRIHENLPRRGMPLRAAPRRWHVRPTPCLVFAASKTVALSLHKLMRCAKKCCSHRVPYSELQVCRQLDLNMHPGADFPEQLEHMDCRYQTITPHTQCPSEGNTEHTFALPPPPTRFPSRPHSTTAAFYA
jgi:hypothetical protein